MSQPPFALRLSADAALALAPILVAQGSAVRRDTPQLPGAAGPTEGVAAGPEPALRLVVLGESTVAGVGAATHAEALTGQVAAALAARLGRAVAWRAEGQIGITARRARLTLVPALPPEPAHLALVALGVNDSLKLRAPGRWAADLTDLIAALRERIGPAPVFLAPVPPMGSFPALPQPLRTALGLRAQLLDATAAALAPRLDRVIHLPLAAPAAPELFCADGFHPGPEGYRKWGAALAEGIAGRIEVAAVSAG